MSAFDQIVDQDGSSQGRGCSWPNGLVGTVQLPPKPRAAALAR
jgi:hypothetical protein